MWESAKNVIGYHDVIFCSKCIAAARWKRLPYAGNTLAIRLGFLGPIFYWKWKKPSEKHAETLHAFHGLSRAAACFYFLEWLLIFLGRVIYFSQCTYSLEGLLEGLLISEVSDCLTYFSRSFLGKGGLTYFLEGYLFSKGYFS